MNKIEETIRNIELPDATLMRRAQERLDHLTKPAGSLGRLEDLAKQIVAVSRKERPALKRRVIFVFAADHGVAAEGVSAYPKEVTAQMVYNFIRGGAGINILARQAGAEVLVADLGVAEPLRIESPAPSTPLNTSERVAQDGMPAACRFVDRKIASGTRNMAQGAAMSREEAVKAIETGITLFEEESARGIDIVGTGDMGIGNTTASSAITAVFTGKPVRDVTGHGTGIDAAGLKKKIETIEKALAKNRPDPRDPLDVLAKVGGYEIGGLSGVILAAAARKIPVVIDGFISGAAALVACHIEPKAKLCLIAAHASVEKGHQAILSHLGLVPLLNLEMRLGEGTGAALAMVLSDSAVKILNEMATFEGAGVSQKTGEQLPAK